MKNIITNCIEHKYGKTEIYGTYAGDVTYKDILDKFGNGMYHEFRYFGDGTFIFVKYENTDDLIA
jgi:hypothetical protein